MITLNEIAYNIKNLAYGGKNSSENNITTSQIKHWIHYHRAKLIADNIDKGITNNESLYQNMDLTVANSVNKNIAQYWLKFIGGATTEMYRVLSTSAFGSFVGKHPRSTLYLYGEWLAESIISNPDNPGYPDNGFSHINDWYGENTTSSQNKGDFRNFGNHKFFIPRPLQLKNDAGIKDVRITRGMHRTDITDGDTDTAYKTNFISLYRKEFNDYDKYNKFTNRKHPYYTQEVMTDSTRIVTTTANPVTLEPKIFDTSNKCVLSLEQLQVTPNYHGGLNSPGEYNVYWKYMGKVSAILENPTDIDTMWSLEDIRNIALQNLAVDVSLSEIKRIKWDDSENPYPIPMEYVSDLIQRVIQIEMQTELKTQADEVTDGIDDNIKRRGAQAQR
tara:strand:- start:1521 stop:2687 length:1167 start_codon:yes stop_codon:yes gene_type:complete